MNSGFGRHIGRIRRNKRGASALGDVKTFENTKSSASTISSPSVAYASTPPQHITGKQKC